MKIRIKINSENTSIQWKQKLTLSYMKYGKSLVFASSILITVLLMGACGFSQIKNENDLPDNAALYSNPSAKMSLPSGKYFRYQPTKVDVGQSGSIWGRNTISQKDLLKLERSEYIVIGDVKLANSELFYFVNTEIGYFFIKEKDYSFLKIAKNKILSDKMIRKIRKAMRLKVMVIPEYPILNGGRCNFDHKNWWRMKNVNFANDTTIQSFGVIFQGSSSSFQSVGKYLSSNYPLGTIVCGNFPRREILETRSGMMRAFAVYELTAFIIDWYGSFYIFLSDKVRR